MENETSVYGYQQTREFLCSVLQEKRKVNPRYSLRAWSRKLGFKTPSYLSAVLRGTRRPKPHLLRKVGRQLKLSQDEVSYLELLAQLESAVLDKESIAITGELAALRQSANAHSVNSDEFRLIADWYHFAILEMFALKDFKADPDYISRRLEPEILPQLASAAIRRLLEVGLLEKRKSGAIKRRPGEARTSDGAPNAAIQSFHRSQLELAERALRGQEIQERDFRASTFCIEKKDMAAARNIIKRCHTQLRALASERGDEVYRFGSQFFRLTKKGDV